MEIAAGIIISLAATLYVMVNSKRKWLKVLAVGLNVLLNILLVNLAIAYARIDANIMQGAPVYLVLENLRGKIEENDETVVQDIDNLLKELDLKNAGGSNGPVMMKYIKEQRQQTNATQAQP